MGRRELLAKRLAELRPSLSVIARLGPTREARARAVLAQDQLAQILGPQGVVDRAKAAALSATALTETLRLATIGSARQPGTQWTPFRLAPVSLVTRVRSRIEAAIAAQADRARAALARGQCGS